MTLTLRPYQHEDDYWRIRVFLREIGLLDNRHEITWQVARLDYWRWHVIANCEPSISLEDQTFLWETNGGQLAAVLNLEGRGDAHCQVHPAYRTPDQYAAMLAVAEQHLAIHTDDGRSRLTPWAHAHNTVLQSVLAAHGYTKGDWPEHKRTRVLNGPITVAQPAPGYTIRALGDADELPARSWASWRAFHPDEPDEAYQGWTWYHGIQRIPQYRRDLDVVAAAPDGTIAGFCTLWYDDVTRMGYFEPVGVVPEHQQRGLGKALMTEALRRIQCLGATLVSVGGYSAAANALYSAVMSPDCELIERWEKTW